MCILKCKSLSKTTDAKVLYDVPEAVVFVRCETNMCCHVYL